MFTLDQVVDWDNLPTEIIGKYVATTADLIFRSDPTDSGRDVNAIYLFKTEHLNLFLYTTDCFLPGDLTRFCSLSLVIYEEDQKRLYYRHQHGEDQNVWREMENSYEEWIDAVCLLMMNEHVKTILGSEST